MRRRGMNCRTFSPDPHTQGKSHQCPECLLSLVSPASRSTILGWWGGRTTGPNAALDLSGSSGVSSSLARGGWGAGRGISLELSMKALPFKILYNMESLALFCGLRGKASQDCDHLPHKRSALTSADDKLNRLSSVSLCSVSTLFGMRVPHGTCLLLIR